MSDERKAVWPWIVALLIGLPVLYVASFGPACWLVERGVLPLRTTAMVFRPLLVATVRGRPPIVPTALRWYAGLLTQPPLDPVVWLIATDVVAVTN
jgi:hypothetical protein